MQTKKYTYGITIFTTPEMYQEVRKKSDELNISLAELVRKMVRQYFENFKAQNQEVQNHTGSKQDNAK